MQKVNKMIFLVQFGINCTRGKEFLKTSLVLIYSKLPYANVILVKFIFSWAEFRTMMAKTLLGFSVAHFISPTESWNEI